MANAGPSQGFLSRYFSNPFRKKKRTGDIDLPLEGRRDPRLPRQPTSRETGESIKKGWGILRELASKSKEK
jgi:hypothetical protein